MAFVRTNKEMLCMATTSVRPKSSDKLRCILHLSVACLFLVACDGPPHAQAETPKRKAIPVIPASSAPAPAEPELGVRDLGIFGDLDKRLQFPLLTDADGPDLSGLHDSERGLLTVYQGDWPLKVYPTKAPASALRKDLGIALRPGDYQEIAGHLAITSIRPLAKGESPKPGDADGDGIADPLDLLLGAHKTVLNGANYGGGYRRIPYPNGDIPREDGVCTDVVVRAVRNLGVDIQEELQKDIKKRPRAFPMVKKRNANIDHRRVKTLLPYFLKQWDLRSGSLDDSEDPWRPGDIVFMDTFPKRKGPDHIGVLSNTRAPSGRLMVINNWTNGFSTSEMDLLGSIPVTHRFRIKPGS